MRASDAEGKTGAVRLRNGHVIAETKRVRFEVRDFLVVIVADRV
jgi:hypothetical protein